MSDTTDTTRPEEAEVRPDSAASTAEGSTHPETSTTIDNPAETAAPAADSAPEPDAADTPAVAEASPVAEEPTETPIAEEDAPESSPAETEAAEATAAEADTTAETAPEAPVTEATPDGAEATSDSAEAAPDSTEAPTEELAAKADAETTQEKTEAVTEAEASETKEEAPADAISTAAEVATETAEKSVDTAEATSSEQASEEKTPEEPPIDPALLSPRQRRILELKTAMDEKSPVEGTVIGWNQGGFHISIDGVGAFVPSSLMELGQTKDPAIYIDQTFLFRVIKHQKQGRRIVLSRVPVLREIRRKQLAELRGKLEVGAQLKGKVSSLTGFGAFVDLGGLEGLVHVSELSHQRINNPTELLQVGQEVEVKVLKIEKKGKRVSLSMKALEPDPWSEIAEKFGAGKKFTGKILRHTEFGIFIELEPGIEGLLHSSQLRPGMKMADQELAVGSEIEGWIRVCEPKRQRLSLSLREVAEGDPWAGIEERYPDGKLVQGKVEQIAPFGAFIQLEPGLTGLLPQSEMRIPKGADPRRQYAPGQDITVQVVDIDRGRRRLSLALEGARVEGSKADIEAFKKAQKKSQSPDGGGLNALAAAFEKARRK